MLFFLIMVGVRRLITVENRPDISYLSQAVSPLDYGRILSNAFLPTGTMGSAVADVVSMSPTLSTNDFVVWSFLRTVR